MGFSVGKTFGTVAGAGMGMAGGGAGMVGGALLGSKAGEKVFEGTQDEQREKQKRQLLSDLKKQEDEAKRNSVDPRLHEIANQQLALANKTRSDIGNTGQDIYNQNLTSNRLGLAQNLAGVRQSANSRGLLYSGLRQSQEAQAQGGAAGNLAGQAYQTNLGLENQARQMEGQALESANRTADAERQLAESISGQRVADQKERAEAIGKIGMAGGQLAGMGIGAMQSSSANNKQKAKQANADVDQMMGGMRTSSSYGF